MALRDSIDILSETGAIYLNGSFDQRAWLQENEMLEYDAMLETVDIYTLQWPACTLDAVLSAKFDAEEFQAYDDGGIAMTQSARYTLENKKTKPRAYAFELTVEVRKRFRNGEVMEAAI